MTPNNVYAWNQRALDHANAVSDDRVKEFYPSLYLNMGQSFELLGDQKKPNVTMIWPPNWAPLINWINHGKNYCYIGCYHPALLRCRFLSPGLFLSIGYALSILGFAVISLVYYQPQLTWFSFLHLAGLGLWGGRLGFFRYYAGYAAQITLGKYYFGSGAG